MTSSTLFSVIVYSLPLSLNEFLQLSYLIKDSHTTLFTVSLEVITSKSSRDTSLRLKTSLSLFQVVRQYHQVVHEVEL
jgi:hypothetical protein